MSNQKLRETKLPGVGIQHDFELENGQRVGVITHHSGSRDFLVFSENDPDMCSMSLHLAEGEARTLGELFGASQVTQSLARMEEIVGGMSIDWLAISDDWACAGERIADRQVSQTGVLIVAVVRDGNTIPTPTGDFMLKAGDTLVVVGTPEAIQTAHDSLHGVTAT
jgi:TrkA domain protein